MKLTTAFEPSERWLAHERAAAKRRQRNDARKSFIKDTVKWIVVPFAVVAICCSLSREIVWLSIYMVLLLLGRLVRLDI